MGRQTSDQGRRRPSAGLGLEGLEGSALHQPSNRQHRRQGRQQVQYAGRKQAAEEQLEAQLRIADDGHLDRRRRQGRARQPHLPRPFLQPGRGGGGDGRGLAQGRQGADGLEGAVEGDGHLLRAAECALGEARGEMGDAVDLAPPHQGDSFVDSRRSVGHAHAGAGLHVADRRPAEGGVVLIDHGDRSLMDHAGRQHGGDDRQQDQGQAKRDEGVPWPRRQTPCLVANGANEGRRTRDGRPTRHREDQSNRTLMPGRRLGIGLTGLAFT